MKHSRLLLLVLCVTAILLLSQPNTVLLTNPNTGAVLQLSASQADQPAQTKILEGYGKLPLAFVANQGQMDSQVKFLSRTGGYTLFLTGDEAVLALRGSNAKNANAAERDSKLRPRTVKPTIDGTSGPTNERTGAVLRMKLRNANRVPNVTGENQLAGTSHYLVGNDPTKWRNNIPTYAKVRYKGIYPGIDLVYYGNQQQLEYDFIVAPGVDPRLIAFDILGAKWIRRDGHGDLVLQLGDGEIRWHKPVAYQEKNGTRQLVEAHYALTATNRIGFEVADYDARRPLFIDPLIYSTYLGGSASDSANGIAVDSSGDVYVAGSTESIDFPAVNPLQPINAGNIDIFIAKINPTGSAVIYSTYLGGSGNDFNPKIVVDAAGNAYVTGYTDSSNFPTMNALQPTYGGSVDAFVTKLNPTGSTFVYSTYLGGSNGDVGSDVAVDSSGNAYVSGTTGSTDFPTKNPIQGPNELYPGDVFVSKINPAGSALVYSTCLGGNGADYGTGIAVNGWGSAYVTGWTASGDFPTTPGAFQTTCKDTGGYGCMGGGDAFVARLNSTGSALVYSTYLGGGRLDRAYDIAVDTAQNAYVTGETYSTDFPTMNPMQPASGRTTDGFVTKVNPSGTGLVYSTYLGGAGLYEGAGGIAVDSSGYAYVTGTTNSLDFPTVNALQPSYRGGAEDAFVSKFNPAGSALVYSTYLGGKGYDSGRDIAVDRSGNVYVTGITDANFPTKNALQPVNAGGGSDAFVAKLDLRAVPTTILLSSPNPSAYGQAATITAKVSSNFGAPTDGEIVTFKKGTIVLGTGALSSGSASLTISTLMVGTNLITAIYDGDKNLTNSKSKVLNQVVGKATTTTTVSSSQNPSNFGQAVSFTASVMPQFSGTVTGNVTFYDGTTLLKVVWLSGGVAKFTISQLGAGEHNITATYNGSGNLSSSSASLTQTVH